MGRLYDYVLEVREKSRDQFAKTYQNAFLLLHIEERPTDHQWTFKTQTLSSTGISVAQAMAKQGLKLSPELAQYYVFPVVKAMNNPWPERISVGRARNNDIVLADSSVSKLHAHFSFGDGTKQHLTDAGSRNGTRINEEALVEHVRTAVRPGDVITFGGTTVTYLDAAGLYELIAKGITPLG